MVLARIDHGEPYWAAKAARELTAEGVTVEITPRLRDAIDGEWALATDSKPWSTLARLREIFAEAQAIFDDIRHGRLLIHAHALDGRTMVAVGTYLDSGKSVHLHGENGQRQVEHIFDSPAQALVAFERLHGDTMRPGPAPKTDTERETAEARTSLGTPPAETERPLSVQESVPAYAAGPGDHDALLDAFLDAHGDWEKWRTWSDETTHAIHESQTLRIERVHDAPARETAWTVAAYETPVSDRTWVLTATGATPDLVLEELLDHLANGDGWDASFGAPVDEKAVAAATQPLSDAGWKHTADGRWIRWTSPAGDAGVQFDAFAAQHPQQSLATWTVWAGPGPDRPTWILTASPHTPSSLLAGLSENLVHGVGTRQTHPAGHERKTPLGTAPLATPAVVASPAASRSR